MSNLHHLARYQYQIEVFPVSHLEHAHAAKIFGWAALCFSVAGIFKIRRPGPAIAVGKLPESVYALTSARSLK
jgi:hypothetical protein